MRLDKESTTPEEVFSNHERLNHERLGFADASGN